MENFWKKYNKNLSILSKKITEHNNNNEFNYIEVHPYNHLRDLQSLIISFLSIGKGKIKILDYGSNQVGWSNIINKIDTSKLDISIYDPYDSNEDISLNPDLDIKIYSKLDDLKDLKFDITFLGSVTQYINNLFQEINENKFMLSDFVYFSHTPLSLKSTFESYGYKDFKGSQIIRSYSELINYMEENNYELIFKSNIGAKLADVEIKYEEISVYANLLFKKICLK